MDRPDLEENLAERQSNRDVKKDVQTERSVRMRALSYGQYMLVRPKNTIEN